MSAAVVWMSVTTFLFLFCMDLLRDCLLCLLLGFIMVFTPRALYRMLTDGHHKLHQFPNYAEYDRAVKREAWKSFKWGAPLGLVIWVWLCLL